MSAGAMADYMTFHTQLASIMEVLANAAVAEICQLVDDGFAQLRLEVSRAQRENLALKSRLRLMEVRSRDRCARRAPVPPLVVTCARKARPVEEPDAVAAKGIPEAAMLENTEPPFPKVGVVTEPDIVLIKSERLEEGLTSCTTGEPPQAELAGSGVQCRPLADEDARCLSTEESLHLNQLEIPRINLSGKYEAENFAPPVAQRRAEEEDEDDDGKNVRMDGGPDTCGRGPLRPDQSSGPATEMGNLFSPPAAEERGGADGPCGSSSLGESGGVKTADAEAATLKPLNGNAASVWAGDAADGATSAVKMEAEVRASWSEGSCFGASPCLSALREEVEMSKVISSSDARLCSQSVHRESLSEESKSSEVDVAAFDSSSFDELFSSPDVARSLLAPHRDSAHADGAGLEERLVPAAFPFLAGGAGTFGSHPAPAADPLGDGDFRAPPDARGGALRSGPAQVFTCQQCGRLFSNSRDLVVHQRSHAGERLFHCPLCKKPFLHLHQLKTHQRVHTGEKPFSCTQCGKRFSQSSHIKRHMSVHTGEKRYSCSLCGKRFSQSCSLKVHQAVHTGERPYSCTQCGKSFSVLGNLVRHQSVHIRK